MEELLEGFLVAWYIMSLQFSSDVFEIYPGKPANIYDLYILDFSTHFHRLKNLCDQFHCLRVWLIPYVLRDFAE